MSERFVQVHLSSGDHRLVMSVDADEILPRVGQRLRLKDAENPLQWWTVDAVSRAFGKPKRGWDNNI